MVDATDILKAKILIVDDLDFNVSLLANILKTAGYSAVTSTTNPSAVAALLRQAPQDLILLDIEMPVLDGFGVLDMLQKQHAEDFPAVLVITGEAGYKQRALDAGARDFISKPFELVEVLTRVHNLAETKLLHREVLDHQDDNPSLPHVIQMNIRKINQVRANTLRNLGLQDRMANAMTTFSGSMNFFYFHIVWFLGWILCNTGAIGINAFDPFPYGLLTMVVSLEAIFLSTFVLISQNTLGKEATRLSDLGLQTGFLTEHEMTRALQMLRSIQTHLGIHSDESVALADAGLEMETKLEDVLSEIDRLQRRGSVRLQRPNR
jgi:uncharacterized membrane protein/CheY-like chemotaxis protein